MLLVLAMVPLTAFMFVNLLSGLCTNDNKQRSLEAPKI